MASFRAFQLAARLATSTAALMFGLIVVGSVVRTTGSGLACPDWPLCHGRLIPPLQFNVFIEWFHRLLALCVGLLLFSTAGTILARRETRGRLGGLAALAVALYLTQALLGALTVWKLLDPSIVSGHLAVGLMLFSTLVATAMLARQAAGEDERPAPGVVRPEALLPLFAVATLLTWCQAVLGGMVSTNHASLACPDWPTCNGQWFPAIEGLVGLQVLHRLGAYALALVLGAVALLARRAPDAPVRGIARALPWLVLGQLAIGVANVVMGIPVWVSALHLANATAILALLLIATFRLAALPAPRATWAPAEAR
jgi:cytochrome c oxidase assembly protein subunit 15